MERMNIFFENKMEDGDEYSNPPRKPRKTLGLMGII
jgi:hypothetical protein